jgi:hypothetical protein
MRYLGVAVAVPRAVLILPGVGKPPMPWIDEDHSFIACLRLGLGSTCFWGIGTNCVLQKR